MAAGRDDDGDEEIVAEALSKPLQVPDVVVIDGPLKAPISTIRTSPHWIDRAPRLSMQGDSEPQPPLNLVKLDPDHRNVRSRTMTSPRVLLASLVVSLGVVASCGSGSILNETRLIEVHGNRAYLSLSNAINDSNPPSCGGAAIDTRNNLPLHRASSR